MDGVAINIKGYEVLISKCDLERIQSHNWCKAANQNKRVYFGYRAYGQNEKFIYLHRFIVDCPSGMEVDHVNMNTLDNRRENLRICSHARNNCNKRKYKTNTSGYKGVYWHKQRLKWVAEITSNRKKTYLGCFLTAEEAYAAYCIASKKYHDEYGRTV